jgi:NAD+ kinase
MGFLAESATEELFDRLEAIQQNKYHIEERMMIEGWVTSQEEKHHALNDIAVVKGNWARVIKLETFLGEEYLNTYVADGLVVSTPTGSTAYALSTGGPIVIPTMNALVVSPINPHSLSVRPIVIPSDKLVRVVIKSADANILFSADGQTVKNLVENDVIEIQRSEINIKLIKFPGKGFFEVMRNKLHWGDDIRSDK